MKRLRKALKKFIEENELKSYEELQTNLEKFVKEVNHDGTVYKNTSRSENYGNFFRECMESSIKGGKLSSHLLFLAINESIISD